MIKTLFVIVLAAVSTTIYAGTFYTESISVGDTAVGISNSAKDAELKRGMFSVEGGNVRYWTDGTAPTSSTGHILYEGDYITVLGVNNLLNIKFIRTGSITTTLRASYEN